MTRELPDICAALDANHRASGMSSGLVTPAADVAARSARRFLAADELGAPPPVPPAAAKSAARQAEDLFALEKYYRCP